MFISLGKGSAHFFKGVAAGKIVHCRRMQVSDREVRCSFLD